MISPKGDIYHINSPECIISPSYHSTNGYDFSLLVIDDCSLETRMFPIDDIIAMAYIPIPSSLKGKNVKVSHINGDTRDISLDNLQWVEDIEEWRVCTYPGVKPDMYEVSSWGRVRNKITKNMIGHMGSAGYLVCTLVTIDRKERDYMIHRLISYQFLKEIFDSECVNHINGIKTCNYPKNIENTSLSNNSKHAFITNLSNVKKGEDSEVTKLTNNDVEKICRLIVKYNGHIPEIYNECIKLNIPCTKAIIRSIRYKAAWVDISDRYFKNKSYKNYICGERSKLTNLKNSDVHLVCKAIVKLNGNINAVEKYCKMNNINITRDTIHNIKCGKSWKAISKKYFNINSDIYTYHVLTEKDVIKILESIKMHSGNKNTTAIVYNELKDKIKNVTKSKIKDIKNGKSWKHLRDIYLK